MADDVRGKVLDFGAGNCLMAKLVTERGHEVVPCDVVDYNATGLKLVVYDGGALPFRDREFQTVIALGSLHHIRQQPPAIRELARVCGGQVMVFEYVPVSWYGYAVTAVSDYVMNGLASGFRVSVPFTIRDKEDWAGLFHENGLVVRRTEEHAIGVLARLSTLFGRPHVAVVKYVLA